MRFANSHAALNLSHRRSGLRAKQRSASVADCAWLNYSDRQTGLRSFEIRLGTCLLCTLVGLLFAVRHGGDNQGFMRSVSNYSEKELVPFVVSSCIRISARIIPPPPSPPPHSITTRRRTTRALPARPAATTRPPRVHTTPLPPAYTIRTYRPALCRGLHAYAQTLVSRGRHAVRPTCFLSLLSLRRCLFYTSLALFTFPCCPGRDSSVLSLAICDIIWSIIVP